MQRTLYRSRRERMIAGVCGGIAEYYGLDPSIVRLLAIALFLVMNFGVVVAYIVAAIVIPEEPLEGEASAEGLRPPDMAFWPRQGPVTEGGVSTMSDEETRPGEAPEGPATSTVASPPPPMPPAPPYTPTPNRPRRGGGGIVGGLILIGLGLLFLAQEFLDIDVGRLWPLILIVIGLAIVVGAFRRRD